MKVCPALRWTGERHVCSLCELPGDMGRRYRTELAVGSGCCASLNSWRNETLIDRTLTKTGVVGLDPVFQLFLGSLGRQMLSGDALVRGFTGEMIDRGYSKFEAKSIAARVFQCVKEQRSLFDETFMG